ncbi:hypothetical protein TNCV_1776681 [Trichonephila clavipes]|nr:hypothetical protein TNCV_1776681 [Trichonephila clavipes]
MNRLYPNSRRESGNENRYLNTLPRRGGGWRKKRPDENEKNIRYAGRNGGAQGRGGLTAPKRVRGAPKRNRNREAAGIFFFFFAAGVKREWRLQDGTCSRNNCGIEAGASFNH